MPLPRHDDQPLPSRRALREAERARAASGAQRAAVRRPGEPARTVVPPLARAVVEVLPDHVLEGGDDVWASDVAPRPTPVPGRPSLEPAPPVADVLPRRDRERRDGGVSGLRRVPQLVVLGSLVAATVGYVSTGDTTATAGAVGAFEREEQTVSAEAATVVAPTEDASGVVAGDDGLLRVRTDEASRSGGGSVLPDCDGVPPETPQPNGRMDETYLCTLWDGKTEIRADAAVSLALLNEAYRAHFGRDICVTDGYRSYAAQVSVRNRKPGLAAKPGTSEHGFGLAVDLCGGVESAGEGYWWLRENAGAYGYENPRWAQRGGGGPYEPWHWEYVAGQW